MKELSKKFLVFLLTILVSIVIASLFGIIHDQITYTISNEYYTKFKFFQFGIVERGTEGRLSNARIAVCKVGVLATWWVGKYIGIVFGISGLLFRNSKEMIRAISKAVGWVFLITVVTSFIGFIYGNYFVNPATVNWWFPENLVQKKEFVTVGMIHNFSYFGGALGLIFGVIYLITKNSRSRSSIRSEI